MFSHSRDDARSVRDGKGKGVARRLKAVERNIPEKRREEEARQINMRNCAGRWEMM
jgi:hypothetical protein